MMDSIIKIIAKDFVVLPPLVAIIFWLRYLPRSQRRASLIFLISLGLLSYLLGLLAQHLYVNPRPPFKDGASPLFTPSDYNGFPSDHTLFASVIGWWLLTYNRKLGAAMLGLALIIGWARVAAHVHHAVDIAGALLVTTVAYFVVKALLKPKTKKPTKTANPRS
jgi:undecaprenyl-diphosphatase